MPSNETEWRPLQPEDAAACTELAFKSKRGWGYPEEWIELWRDGLTVTPEFIRNSWSLATFDETSGQLAGFVAVICDGVEAEVEHLWIDPSRQGSGLGRKLFEAALAYARDSQCGNLIVISDPNALGFYEKMGGQAAGSVPSMPVGRELPRLIFSLRPSRGRPH